MKPDSGGTAFVTGASRGLGLEFVKQYADAGWRVIATCRRPKDSEDLGALARRYPNQVRCLPLDVTSPQQIDDVAALTADIRLDLLINNAGVYGSRLPSLTDLDDIVWAQTFAVNCIAPIKLIQVLLPPLRRSDKAVVANMTSKMASISDNSSGRSIIYRSTKAALNAATKSVAIELEPHGIPVILLHPGWVQTDMGGPNALVDATTSVNHMRTLLARLTTKDTGKFFDFNGAEIPW